MDRFESCRVALRSELKEALHIHKGTRAWHYGLNLDDSNHSSSLSKYLRLTHEQYEDVLLICGLAKKKKYRNNTRLEIDRIK